MPGSPPITGATPTVTRETVLTTLRLNHPRLLLLAEDFHIDLGFDLEDHSVPRGQAQASAPLTEPEKRLAARTVEILGEMFHGALHGQRRQAAQRTERAVEHGVAEIVQQREILGAPALAQIGRRGIVHHDRRRHDTAMPPTGRARSTISRLGVPRRP